MQITSLSYLLYGYLQVFIISQLKVYFKSDFVGSSGTNGVGPACIAELD